MNNIRAAAARIRPTAAYIHSVGAVRECLHVNVFCGFHSRVVGQLHQLQKTPVSHKHRATTNSLQSRLEIDEINKRHEGRNANHQACVQGEEVVNKGKT